MPSFASRNYVLAIAAKKYAKIDTKFSSPVPFYWISLLYYKYFVRDCRY